MDSTSMEATTGQWSVQDVISTFMPGQLMSGVDGSTSDAAALAQTLQSLFSTSDTSLLASQMQLMQAAVTATSNGQAANQMMLMPSTDVNNALSSLSWQYPMMVLPTQAWAQSLGLDLSNSADAQQSQLYNQALQQLQFQNQSPAEGDLVLASSSNKAGTGSPAAGSKEVTIHNGSADMGHHSNQLGYNQEQQKSEPPKPPKKPLSPYMSFSKAIWAQVKAANPNMSVCEVGAMIGRLWRELDDIQKQRYNDAFTNDKQRYDVELQMYLKLTGLQASDLSKPRTKKVQSKPAVPLTQAKNIVYPTLTAAHTDSQSPMKSQSQGAQGTASTDASNRVDLAAQALPHFTQVWTGGQPSFIDQNILAQMTLAGQTLYTNRDGTIHISDLQTSKQLDSSAAYGHQLLQNSTTSKSNSNLVKTTSSTSSQQQSTNNLWSQLVSRVGNPNLVTNIFSGENQKQETDQESFGQPSSGWDHADAGLREAILEQELHALKDALSEKTQEAQALMNELEQVNNIIEQLKQTRQDTNDDQMNAGLLVCWSRRRTEVCSSRVF